MRSPALFVFATFAMVLSLPFAGQSATGMSAMQYYVGTWSCTGGAPGEQPANATLKYTMDAGMLEQTVNVPRQGKMKSPYFSSSSEMYDAKNDRYVTTNLDNSAVWGVSYSTLSGNTEYSVDTATKDGKLGHATTVRMNNDMFKYTAYPTKSGTKPNFQATCRRSS